MPLNIMSCPVVDGFFIDIISCCSVFTYVDNLLYCLTKSISNRLLISFSILKNCFEAKKYAPADILFQSPFLKKFPQSFKILLNPLNKGERGSVFLIPFLSSSLTNILGPHHRGRRCAGHRVEARASMLC